MPHMPFIVNLVNTSVCALIPWVSWIPGYHTAEWPVVRVFALIQSPNMQAPSSNYDDNVHNMRTLCSECSGPIDTTVNYLTGLDPDQPPVPVIPPSITGQCVYGHILDDKNRDHFRQLYPKIAEWQTSDSESLVCIASLVHYQKGLAAATADVYDQGHWKICLVYVDCRSPGRATDKRRNNEFREGLEGTLGIAGEPKWYPCYAS